MTYAAVGAIDLQTAPLPKCAPADVIADAKSVCALYSSVKGYGALNTAALNLPVSHAYSDNPQWSQHSPCEVASLPLCPTMSALTYTPPKVSATLVSYTAPRPPTLTAAPAPAPRPPTLTSAPAKVSPALVMQVSPGLFVHKPATVEAGMSGMQKAGILALVALAGYAGYRYLKH